MAVSRQRVGRSSGAAAEDKAPGSGGLRACLGLRKFLALRVRVWNNVYLLRIVYLPVAQVGDTSAKKRPLPLVPWHRDFVGLDGGVGGGYFDL